MKDHRMAVVGMGATGAVLAAAILTKHPETVVVDPKTGWGEGLKKNGIRVSGAVSYLVPVKHFVPSIRELRELSPDLLFLSTKTFHLPQVLRELEDLFIPGTKIISTHNGLGTEDLIADRFGKDAAFRMSLNFGVSLNGPGDVTVAFFNRPNYLGCLTRENRELGLQTAKILTDAGLDTEFVDDIKLYVWKKMIHKGTLASICAITDRTRKDVMNYPPTREIADACFKEALAVAKAMGYDLGEDYLTESVGYLEKAGVHKDSMCFDLASRTPTEIDFLGGKIVEYGRASGVPTPFFVAMSNVVRALEDTYLAK